MRTPKPVRGLVYEAVRRYPGIHLRGVEREVGISAALAQYHLRQLLEDGLVQATQQGSYLRFFVTEEKGSRRLTDEDRQTLGLLREEVPLHVVLLLLDEGPLTHAELVARTALAKSTVSYHLAKLAEGGVVERESGSTRIRLARRAVVTRLLLAHPPTEDLIDRFAELWGGLYD